MSNSHKEKDLRQCPICQNYTDSLKNYALIGLKETSDPQHYYTTEFKACPQCMRRTLKYKISHCFSGIVFFLVPMTLLMDWIYWMFSKKKGHSRFVFDARNLILLFIFIAMGIWFAIDAALKNI